MPDIPSPENDPLYKIEANEHFEALLGELATGVARRIEDPERLGKLITLLGGKAAFLAHGLQEFASYQKAEALEEAWACTWKQLSRVMMSFDDDPTCEVATVIDRASSRIFPSDYDDEGRPSSIALLEFYRRFATRIDTPSVHLTAAWLQD